VDQRVEEIVEDMFGGDRNALLEALARDRLTYEAWRETMRDQLVVGSMRSANVDQLVHVAPGAVRAHYEAHPDDYQRPAKVKLRMVVLGKPSAGEVARVRQEAEALCRRAREGEDMAVLARAHSEGTHARDGGDWGWIEPAQALRRELARAIAALATGAVSDVIETPEQFYILKVEARREASVAPFEDVQPEIERRMRREENERRMRVWLDRLRDRAYVQTFHVDPF
jgi:peptidyl-prolyl cis-trans isomerase SurA